MKYFGGLLEMARSRARNFIVNEKTARIYGTAGVIFILLSVILVGISVYNFNYAQRAISEGESISAVCTKKWSESKRTRHKVNGVVTKSTVNTSYYADATYIYGGQTYYCHRLSSNAATQVGDYIRVYVLPENPGKYVQPEQKSDWFPMIIAFGFTALIGISMLSTSISSIRRFRKYGDNSIPQITGSYHNGINNTYQNYNNQYSTNTYQGYDNQYNPNNTYQNYDNQYNPNNSYQGYDNHNQW